MLQLGVACVLVLTFTVLVGDELFQSFKGVVAERVVVLVLDVDVHTVVVVSDSCCLAVFVAILLLIMLLAFVAILLLAMMLFFVAVVVVVAVPIVVTMIGVRARMVPLVIIDVILAKYRDLLEGHLYLAAAFALEHLVDAFTMMARLFRCCYLCSCLCSCLYGCLYGCLLCCYCCHCSFRSGYLLIEFIIKSFFHILSKAFL